MNHKPTPEQGAVIDEFAAGRSLVVEAVAGAGKTSTLRMAAAAVPDRRCLYVAYNRALADDAKGSMPGNVEARTAHSLAYREVGWRYKGRLDGPRVPAWQAAKIMYAGGSVPATRVLNSPVDLGGVVLRPAALARIALDTVDRYCQSADRDIADHHVPRQEGVTGLARQALVDIILPIANLAWSDLRHPSGKLRHVPDHYLKVWALGDPVISADCILFDEAQDANPVLSAVLTAQHGAQLVAVGDPCQQLYAWRGSVDALATWPADIRLTLSQSFRFGPAVADRANRWLDLLAASTRVIGAPWIDSTVGPVEAPDAVLCRTNAGAMREVMERLAGGGRVHLVGGGGEIRRLAEAADKLIHGEPTDHPELAAFSSWDEVVRYVAEDDGGSDLAPAVKLIEEYGADEIMATVDRLALRTQDADVVISTGHKAKGLQWPQVVIGDDYREPIPTPYPTLTSPRKALVLRKGELMLAYVAVTRAQLALDDSGLSWVDRIHGYGMPVVVVGEDRGVGQPAPVARVHPPEAILPDAPEHPVEEDDDLRESRQARQFLAADCRNLEQALDTLRGVTAGLAAPGVDPEAAAWQQLAEFVDAELPGDDPVPDDGDEDLGVEGAPGPTPTDPEPAAPVAKAPCLRCGSDRCLCGPAELDRWLSIVRPDLVGAR